MVCSLHSVTTGSRDRANVSLIIIIIIIIIIINLSCRHPGLNPRRTFCVIIFQLLFQHYHLPGTYLFIKTESCIREPIIRNQLLFHSLYLPDDRVRLNFLRMYS